MSDSVNRAAMVNSSEGLFVQLEDSSLKLEDRILDIWENFQATSVFPCCCSCVGLSLDTE